MRRSKRQPNTYSHKKSVRRSRYALFAWVERSQALHLLARSRDLVSRFSLPALLVVPILLVPTLPVETPEVPIEVCDGHAHRHTVSEHRVFSRNVWSHYKVTRAQKQKHAHMVRCAALPAGKAAMRKEWRRDRKKHDQRFYWRLAYDRLSASDKAWARSTSLCESGGNPRTNTGNGFYGAFQFTASTAYAAGFKKLPHLCSYYEQAVRAVHWRNVAGAGQWPVCG